MISSPYLSRPEHLVGFSKVLISGDADVHEFARRRLNLEPLDNSDATWRLYRVKPR